MSKSYSIAEARNNLAAIVHELEVTDGIELTRRGTPVAVLISKQEYDRLQPQKASFWQAYKNYAKQVNLAELDMEPSEIFGGLRDRTSGRKITL